MSIERAHITTLDTLAATVNREHELSYRSALDALTHAILCGEALIEARATVPDGEWLRWVADNLTISAPAMNRYTRIAKYKDQLLSADKHPQSVNAAVNYLREIGAPSASTGRSGKRPTFDVSEAKRLRREGLSFTQIGEALGVSDVAVWRQLTPGAKAQTMRYTARAKKQRRAERRALERQLRDDAVKRTGGNPAKAYALLRQCAIALDQSLLESNDPDRLEALRDALAHTHKAEDAIVRALRLGRAASEQE